MGLAARTITRFGRTYTEFDPSGGGGPSTWILSSAGAGTSGGVSTTPSGAFTPSVVGGGCPAGAVLYLRQVDQLDLAIAVDGPTTTTGVQPWEAIGLATMAATAGQRVGVTTDGQMQLADWTAVAGTADLVPGATYYLSATRAGGMDVLVPSGAGVTVVQVGRAISARTLEIEIDIQVRLS